MKRSIFILAMLVLPLAVMAQSTYKISPQSSIEVAGTSTMHDWTMLSSSVQGEAQLTVEAGKFTDIKRLQLSLASESLKSGKNAMDKNAYAALKTDKYPTIQFKLGTLNKLEQHGNGGVMTVSGMLTIAGVSKPETIDVRYTLDKDGNLQCQGKKEITMSRYGIAPPSFMFGSVTTGDAITISFTIQLYPTQQITQ